MNRKRIAGWIVIVVLGFALAACSGNEPAPGAAMPEAPTNAPKPTVAQEATAVPQEPAETAAPVEEKAEEPMDFQLTSMAFELDEPIPAIYSCDGDDLSPALAWSGLPEGTVSLALIMDDPDAPVGTWVHWVLYNIPADGVGLEQGIAPDAQLPDGSLHGKNSWSRLGYGGPCPPDGTHRYFFKLYALDMMLEIGSGATKEALLQAINDHVLAETELMGTYTR